MKNIIGLSIKVFILIAIVKSGLALGATGDMMKAASLAIDLSLPEGVPVAGYGGGKRRQFNPFKRTQYSHFFKANDGVADPIRAKILLLEKDGLKLLWVSVDLVAAPPQLVEYLADHVADLGIARDNIFVSASHTHSGPGAFVDNAFWGFVAVDRFKEEIFFHIADAILWGVRATNEKLAPALVGAADVRIENVTNNRRKASFLDPIATIMRFDGVDGQPIATLFNFPIHGTVQGTSNLHLSSDVSGAIERRIEEQTGSVGFFLNGAEGDVSPQAGDEPDAWERAQSLGRKIADRILEKRASLPVAPSRALKHVSSKMDLPPAKMNIFTCIKKKGIGRIYLRLSRWLPHQAPFHAVLIDDTAFVTIAGEPIAELGMRIKQFGLALGFTRVGVVSLTNDHLAYILTPEEYRKGGSESCASFYGEDLGNLVQNASEGVLSELAKASQLLGSPTP